MKTPHTAGIYSDESAFVCYICSGLFHESVERPYCKECWDIFITREIMGEE